MVFRYDAWQYCMKQFTSRVGYAVSTPEDLGSYTTSHNDAINHVLFRNTGRAVYLARLQRVWLYYLIPIHQRKLTQNATDVTRA